MADTIVEQTADLEVSAAEEILRPDAQPRLIPTALLLLSLGHLTVDLFSSAVPTLQPLLVQRFSLSLAQAGVLGGTFMLASAVMQLPFGVLSDRLHSRLFTVLGPLVAGVFLSILPAAAGFKTLLLLVVLGGMGVAAFHPQSVTQAAALSGRRRGLSMALFITSGMFGMALGPTYFSTIISTVGLGWFGAAMIPAIVVSTIFWLWLPSPVSGKRKPGVDLKVFRAAWKPVSLLYLLVVLRSVVQLGIGQFLTLYLYEERGFTFAETSLVLTLFFASASAGSFLGGNLADRFGGRQVVVVSMIGCCPFLWLFLATDGWLSLGGLFLGGLMLLLTMPVTVLMAQGIVPSQAGTVTALMMGFAWGIAGITFIPAIGWLADRVGLQAVFWGVVMIPLLGFVLSLWLPADSRTRQLSNA